MVLVARMLISAVLWLQTNSLLVIVVSNLSHLNLRILISSLEWPLRLFTFRVSFAPEACPISHASNSILLEHIGTDYRSWELLLMSALSPFLGINEEIPWASQHKSHGTRAFLALHSYIPVGAAIATAVSHDHHDSPRTCPLEACAFSVQHHSKALRLVGR